MSIYHISEPKSGSSTTNPYFRQKFAPENGNFSAKSQRVTDRQVKEYENAKTYLNYMTENEVDPLTDESVANPNEVAERYFREFPHIKPYPMRPCRAEEQRAAWRMFNRYQKPMTRLFGSLDQPHLYTLHAEHLDLPPVYGNSTSFQYHRELINAWKDALKEKFNGTYFWRLEIASRIHVHVIASHDAGLLDLPRTGEIVKPIKPGTELKLVAYLCKPRATSSPENLSQWVWAKREYYGNLPKMQGHVDLISARRFFAN